mgnify:CR=1 FL=1
MIVATLNAMQNGSSPEPRLVDMLDPTKLTQLQNREISCLNLHLPDQKTAARLLWKDLRPYFYIGVWNTDLHAQNMDDCR